MSRNIIEIPLNRVEGDLEIRVELDGYGVVTDAWSSGTMYRGFENLLTGRGSLDGLVLTPRICGACSTSHLFAAVRALDAIANVPVTGTGQRIRNVALMAETAQNDLRQAFLMFAVDFANAAHRDEPMWAEAVARYRPLQGDTVVQCIRATKHLLEIVAILGGQWPHSSFMVPGGVVSLPTQIDVMRCRQIVAGMRDFYQRRILGCTLERWSEVRTAADLDAWLEECEAHRDGDLGFFLRFGRALKIDGGGRGHERHLSVGGFEIPEGSAVKSPDGGTMFRPGAFIDQDGLHPFDQARITEHVAHSWFVTYEGGLHPFDGETRPYATGKEGHKYSWAKAPRYADQPAETGALSEMLAARDPLFTDLVATGGPNSLTRELARIARPATYLPTMDQWLAEIGSESGPSCPEQVAVEEGRGFGLVHAARGALGHWVTVRDRKLTHYQIITPTAWNGSPRDAAGVRGPWEQALVGTKVADPENPVEVGYVIRSFDPCLVCTVHALNTKGRTSTLRLMG